MKLIIENADDLVSITRVLTTARMCIIYNEKLHPQEREGLLRCIGDLLNIIVLKRNRKQLQQQDNDKNAAERNSHHDNPELLSEAAL